MVEPDRRPSVAVASQLEPLEAEWDALATRVHAPPFLRPGWIGAWWRAFGTGELELLIVRRDGRLSGVLPLARRWGVLRATSNWHSPDYGLLAEAPVDREALCVQLFERAPRRISLAFLGSLADVELLRTHARDAGYRALVRTLEQSPSIRIDRDWERYEAGLSKNLRRNVRRGLHRLGEEGRVSVQVENGSRRLPESLAECLRIEALSWKGAGRTAIASRPETRRFYGEVARWGLSAGLLRLVFLRLDGRAIAFQLALEDGVAYYPLKGGYDPAYARGSPGILVLHATVAHAFAQGLERYELLGGAEAYKLGWASDRRELKLLQAFAPGVAGGLDWTVYARGRPLAKGLGLDRALGRVGR
jgi:CelD/BcsL family acetyltransferase involved in cellulose biosynthesis